MICTIAPNNVCSVRSIQINGNDLRNVMHREAVNLFHSAGEQVNLLVERGAEQRITSVSLEGLFHACPFVCVCFRLLLISSWVMNGHLNSLFYS